MKNKKTFSTVLGVFIGLLLGATLMVGYLNAEGYINWKGTTHYQGSLKSIDKIKLTINNLQEENDKLKSELLEYQEGVTYYEERLELLESSYNEQNKLIVERDKSILELQKDIEIRDNNILELQSLLEVYEHENNQAFLDVKHIDELLGDLVEGL